MAGSKPNPDDAVGGAEDDVASGSAGSQSQGNSLKDLSDEAVRELESEDEPHAGHGDYG